MGRARAGFLLTLALVCGACAVRGATAAATSTPQASSIASPILSPSPSQSPEASPSASPTTSPSAAAGPTPAAFSCSVTPTAAAEPLVMGFSGDQQRVVIDSFADPVHPATMCRLSGDIRDLKFISRTDIGYAISSPSNDPNDPIGGVTEIQRMSLVDGNPITVASVPGDVMDVAWSPDGSSVAYLAYTYAPNLGSGSANQLWLKVGSEVPTALTPLIPLFGRDGSPDDENIVRFSPDGKYLLMLDTFVSGGPPASSDLAMFQVRSVPEGGLVWVPPSALGDSGNKGGPSITMAAWSHLSDRLYYRDGQGVQTWDAPATDGTLAAGVTWSAPSVSPGDSHVAYAVFVNGQPHIEIRDLASNAVRVLSGIRGDPLFLSDSLLVEAEYGVSSPGYNVPPFSPTGVYFVFNLLTNAETQVHGGLLEIDTWPH